MTSTDWHVLPEDLERYVAGQATPSVEASVEAHLLSCPACRLAVGASWVDLVRHTSAGTTTSAQLTYALTTKWGPVKRTKCVERAPDRGHRR